MAFILAVLAARPVGLPAQTPVFDIFLRSDYGNVFFYLNTHTGDFLWHDDKLKLIVSGRGTLHFPSLGPIIFSYTGEAEGYDWVSLSMKIYGTTATGSLAAYPAGERVRKVVSNFFDKNTQDDMPGGSQAKTKKRPHPAPKIETINPSPSEIPALPVP